MNAAVAYNAAVNLSQKNLQDFLLSLFKGFYSVKDPVNVTNSCLIQ
jgi:hypothetical protein